MTDRAGPGPDKTQDCLNCGTRLQGQYCGNCGQRSRSRLISLWELITDAFGDLFELDSRLWQTLIPLLTRPGQLTHDYLQGRRARFMPPFRMYLVMSLVFFVVAFFDPRESLSLFYEDQGPEVLQDETAVEDEVETGVVLRFEEGEQVDVDEDCDVDDADVEGLPRFLERRLTPERIRRVCEQIVADEGKTFSEKIVENIPTALIVLLPLMALVLKALYPLSRRYYVEHLLFFVHFHAFAFLILTLQVLFGRLAQLTGMPDIVTALTIVVIFFYIPVYLFVAMRRVYGQGRIVTFLKYIVLMAAYLAGFSLIMITTVAIAAFSI